MYKHYIFLCLYFAKLTLMNEVKRLLELMGPVEIDTNFIGSRWSKLLINSAFSGMSAVLGCTFGEAAGNKRSRRIVQALIKECIDVCRAGGIRIDSGDIAYITKKARKMLDAAGLDYCKIVVSNSLDEKIIRDIIRQGACVDAFGVGERLITSKSSPVFGGVYKLCAIEDADGNITPKIKISENTAKITTPHFKKVYRLYNRENGKAEADLICLHDEEIDDSGAIEIFDPIYTWKRKVLENVKAVPLLEPIFIGGKQVYTVPDINESRRRCAEQLDSMWDEVLRWENPHNYYVDLSEELWTVKNSMLRKLRGKS